MAPRTKRWCLLSLCAAAVLAAIAAALLSRSPPRSAAAPARRAGMVHDDPAVALEPPTGQGLDSAAINHIETLLGSDSGFAQDVIFLLAASVRERCNRPHAGELATMARRARLPVLAATSEVTGKFPELDHAIYQFVQRLSDAAPCGRTLDLAPLKLDQTLDIEAYAAAFPDSYYAPGLRRLPPEYAGHSLARRANQGCQSVVYTVLPLGALNWQCAHMWSSTRRRILQLCENERSRSGAVDDRGEVSTQVAQRIAAPISTLMGQLPQACR